MTEAKAAGRIKLKPAPALPTSSAPVSEAELQASMEELFALFQENLMKKKAETTS